MDSLPVCKTRIDEDQQFYRKNDYSYNELINNIHKYIKGDCWAIVVNDEIIYNQYDDNRTCRERLMQRTFRQQIMDNIHESLLIDFIKSNDDSVLDIYMNNPYHVYMIHIYYNPDHSLFCMSKYVR